MISRRTLVQGAGAAVLAGGATLAVTRFERRPAQDAKDIAPNFSVEALGSDQRYQLADFAGGLLLLNFWASWCAPCRVEMPWLIRAYNRYRSQGLTILGVNMDDDGNLPAAERFAREMGVTYPIARNNAAIVSAYGGLRFLPESFLIGRQGEVLQRVFGMPSTSEFEAAMVSELSRR
jgi:thiol-disulfide isomerase/thioredoxin